MTLSSDNAASMLQQHCSGDPVREDQKSFYTDILLSRMISAANSAAALAAAANSASISPLRTQTLTSISSSKLNIEDVDPSTRTLELTNNIKPNKKLSFSVDSLLTSKEKKACMTSEDEEKHENSSKDKKSSKLTEEERAEEEEDLEVDDGEENYDLKNGSIAENDEENITIDERSEAKHSLSLRFNHHESSTEGEMPSSRLAIPKPLIPVSNLPNMNASHNLLAGIAQAMAAAAAANAAANSRYNSLSPNVSITDKTSLSESSTMPTNSLLRTHSGLTAPHLPPGFPLAAIGSRPSFLGKYIIIYMHDRYIWE